MIIQHPLHQSVPVSQQENLIKQKSVALASPMYMSVLNWQQDNLPDNTEICCTSQCFIDFHNGTTLKAHSLSQYFNDITAVPYIILSPVFICTSFSDNVKS